MLGLSKGQKTIKLNLKAKIVNEDKGCFGCIFNEKERPCVDMFCAPYERKDKKNVIWVEA